MTARNISNIVVVALFGCLLGQPGIQGLVELLETGHFDVLQYRRDGQFKQQCVHLVQLAKDVKGPGVAHLVDRVDSPPDLFVIDQTGGLLVHGAEGDEADSRHVHVLGHKAKDIEDGRQEVAVKIELIRKGDLVDEQCIVGGDAHVRFGRIDELLLHHYDLLEQIPGQRRGKEDPAIKTDMLLVITKRMIMDLLIIPGVPFLGHPFQQSHCPYLRFIFADHHHGALVSQNVSHIPL